MQGPCPLVQAVLSDSPGFTRFVCSIRFVLVRSGSSVVRSGSFWFAGGSFWFVLVRRWFVLVLVWFWSGSGWFWLVRSGSGLGLCRSLRRTTTNQNEPERTRTNHRRTRANQNEPERTRTNDNESDKTNKASENG